MSTENLAKLLHVDEVSLMHGPKGLALYVRIEKSWQGVTVDNDDLGEKRMETVAEKLVGLSDQLSKSLGRGETLRKTLQVEPQRSWRSDRSAISWEDDGGWKPWPNEQPQRQVQRSEPPSRPYAPPPPVENVPASSNNLPSRFHAIVAELKKL